MAYLFLAGLAVALHVGFVVFVLFGGLALYRDGSPGAVRAAYGEHYSRLAQIKRAHDPANLFHLNRNILPAS